MSAASRPVVLLFTASPALDGLERALQARGLAAVRVPTVEEGQRLVETRRGRAVVVLDTARPAAYSFAAVYRLAHEAPAIPTLVLVAEGSGPAADHPAGPAAPLDDYLRLPAQVDEIVLRIQALLVRAGLPLPPKPSTGDAPPLARRGRRGGEMIVMFGPKGGVGRSTIASNLAVGLEKLYGCKTVLVDADLWFGDAAVLLDLQSGRSLATLAEHGDTLDADVLRDVLVEHPSGLQVLLSPPDPALVESIPPELPARVANAYRALFDYVVVDTHPSMEEYMLQLLGAADRILLVSTPEMSSVRNTAQVLRLAEDLAIREKMMLVLNRANSGIELEHLQRTVGMPVSATIVSAGRRVVEAANHGNPVLLMDPDGREQFTRDIGHLVALVAGQPDPEWGVQPTETRSPIWRLPWAGMWARQKARTGPAA